MGQLALAVVGTVVGSMFGMPQLGFMLGSLAGSFLFAPSGQHTEGPRLQDLTVTGSAYGQPIAFGIGTGRLGGNMIWSSGLIEHEKTEKQGKGGGGASTTTYTYSASFAVVFCEGVADRALRIWADGKCILDVTGTEDVVALKGMRWQFYPGNEEQLPSAVIESYEGEGQVPAHRGLCYIVFENMPLANFGNRIPSMTAEITMSAQKFVPFTRTPDYADNVPGDMTISDISVIGDVDLKRRRVYVAFPANFGRSDGAILALDSDSMEVVESVPLSNYLTGDVSSIIPVGSTGELLALMFAQPGVTGRALIVYKDGFRVKSILTDAGFQPVWKNRLNGFIKCGTTDEILVARPPLGDTLQFYETNGAWSYDISGWPNTFGGVGCMIARQSDWGNNEVQLVVSNVYTSSLQVAVGKFYASQIIADAFNNVPAQHRTTMPPANNRVYSAAELGYTTFTTQALFYDEYDGYYKIVAFGTRVGGVQGGVLFFYTPEQGIVRTILLSDFNPSGQFDIGCWYKQRIFGYAYFKFAVDSGLMLRVNTVTGETESVVIDTDMRTDGITGVMHNVADGAAVAWTTMYRTANPSGRNRYVKLYLERYRAAGEAAIAPFIQQVAGRVGLAPEDLDVTDLDDTVYGYFVSRVTSARQILAPLASGCQFDAVESDYRMKFFHRGKAPAAALTYNDLQALNNEGDILQETRTQEKELPSRVTIRYPDQDHAYGVGTQQSTRPAVPARTSQSEGVNTVETPVIMNATRAKRLAETTLYTAWQERSGYKLQPDPKYSYLDPTDVITLTMKDGTAYQQRIIKMTLGADLNVSLESLGEDGATYQSSAIGDGGKIPVFPIPQTYASALVMLDIPYLQDADVTTVQPIIYGKMYGYGAAAWSGAVGYKETAADQYEAKFGETNQSTQGATLDALPATSSPWATDEQTKLRVKMASGADKIASVTQAELLNWANAAAVESGGEWEIIQYRDVRVIDAVTLELSGLLRGRRGTDTFTDNHRVGDTVVFLIPNEISIVEYPLSDVGSAHNWKAVSAGDYLEQAVRTPVQAKGNSLKPYAPVQVAITQAANSVITWSRRTRFQGELRDGTGSVPLNETTQAYEVDVYNNAGAVVRTLPATAETVTYTAAQKATDGTAAGFSVIVYQMSEAVGRGFPSRRVSAVPGMQVNQLFAVVMARIPYEPPTTMQVNQYTVVSVLKPFRQMQVNKEFAAVIAKPYRQMQVNKLSAIVLYKV